MAGTVDSTAATGRTYTYSVHRVRTVRLGKHELEMQSEASSRLTLAMADTFPPKIPNGLASISGTTSAGAGSEPAPYIDLSWEPNGEADLAGYRVYRQLARPDGSPQGPLARLTHTVITVSTYRDVAVRAGQGYIYTVTAVDAAGNESAPVGKGLGGSALRFWATPKVDSRTRATTVIGWFRSQTAFSALPSVGRMAQF